MSAGLLVILVCHAEYEAKHIVACDFTNEIVFPALKSAKSCQTVNIVHLSEQKVMFYRASFTSPCSYTPALCQIVGKWLFLLSCEYFFEFPVGPPPGAAPIKPPWTDPRLRFDAAKRMSGDPFLLDPFPPPPPDP